MTQREPEPAYVRPAPADPDYQYGGVLGAMRLYPFTVAICVILLTAAGVALGYAREPTYTAEAELLVGNLSIDDPSAVPGAVGASQALADVYARLIDATDVRRDIAHATRRVDGETTVTATQVVETPVIEVTSTSRSEQGAVDVANAAATALSDYVNSLEAPGSDVKQIENQYRDAQLEYARLRDAYEALQRRIGPSPTDDEQDQLLSAESDLEAAKLKRNALGGLYERGQDIRISQPNLNVFDTAANPTSDRASTMGIGGVLGLVAGLLLGAALATFRANR